MKNETKVLACVDQSRFADYVTDYASWAARRLNAPLELLHVIDRDATGLKSGDRSGALGINAQEQLLNQLTEADENRSKLARDEGRVFLNRLRQRALAAGVAAPDMRQRHGHLHETLAEQEDQIRLFVLGRRGESAEHTQRDLGRNVERIVRNLHKPILTVTEGFTEPKRAMIAFDGGIVTRRGVELVAKSTLFRDMPVHLVMSGKASSEATKQLEWARVTLEQAGFYAPTWLLPGDAEAVIANAVQEQAIDILIMGAYSHSPLRSLLFGSKTADLLRSAKIPTMLLR